MTIKQLEYFMAVARCLSFSEAAASLFISQSALSRAIAALEDEIGTILFLRNKHTVSLTPAGSILATNLPRIDDDLNRTIELVKQVREGVRGRLALGFEIGFNIPADLISAVEYCRKSIPFVSVELKSMEVTDLEQGLFNGKLDFAFVYVSDEAKLSDRLATYELEEHPVCIAVSSLMNISERPTMKELSTLSYVFPEQAGSSSQERWDAYCRSNGFIPKVTHCRDAATFLSMIELGFGAAVVSDDHKVLNAANVKKLEVGEPYSVKTLMVWNSNNLSPTISMFIKLIKEDLTSE